MQKKGNFFLAHLLQNASGRAMMRFPEKTGFGNIVTRSLAAPHQGMKTLPGNAAFGFGRGLSFNGKNPPNSGSFGIYRLPDCGG